MVKTHILYYRRTVESRTVLIIITPKATSRSFSFLAQVLFAGKKLGKIYNMNNNSNDNNE